MSREYVVILVKEPEPLRDIDGQPAKVFMRFTEPPEDDFLQRISASNKGWRVYSLMGASSWFSSEEPQ